MNPKPLFLIPMLFCTVLSAADPSDAHPLGWRGDGTGLYPGATPPLEFSRTLISPLKTIRSQPGKPSRDTASGTPLTAYAGEYRISSWLVLGPIDPPDPQHPLEGNAIPDEAQLEPAEGDATGPLKWKPVESSETLDFSTVFGAKPAGKIAYACAYFYSDEAFRCAFVWRGRIMKQWLNGTPSNGWERAKQDIKKGWNRLLVKVVAPANQDAWDFKHAFFPNVDEKPAYAEKNIRWARPLPSSGWAMPIIVGDKIFVTSEPNDLICLDKRDGKMLWVRSNPVWYAAQENEKAPAEPDPAAAKILDDLKPKIAELEKLDENCLTTTDWTKDEPRRKLASTLTELVVKGAPKYRVNIGWGGGNTGPTPVTDGKNIYAWFGETGVLTCFDLDGQRLWTRFEKPGGGEHGVNSSPVLSGQILAMIAGGHFAAFDKTTGKFLWRQKYAHPSYGTHVLAKIDGVDVFVAPDGQVLRASDGEIIAPPVGKFDGECASAVVDGNRFYLFARAGFCIAELPAKAEKNAGTRVIRMIEPKVLDPDREPYPVGSPVFYDGILYVARSGWGAGSRDVILYAFDAASPEPIYRQKLEMEPVIFYGPEGGGVCASLALTSGPRIHVLDNRGTWITFAPGRQYKQLARNKIDHWTRSGAREVTGTTPVFDGNSIYLRARELLYRIEAP